MDLWEVVLERKYQKNQIFKFGCGWLLYSNNMFNNWNIRFRGIFLKKIYIIKKLYKCIMLFNLHNNRWEEVEIEKIKKRR